ncbi:MAG: tRNA (guanine-N1)-methyltransferase [Bacteroidia bacterium]|nr:tRNA (guanine-N1)-methyltransferase [Bacteroidia bacterium]
MKKLSYFLFGLALISVTASFSQESSTNQTPQEQLSLDSGTIDSQFEFIYRRSGNYRAEGKRYEVVRNIQLDKLRQNVKDSLEAATNKKKELEATIEGNETTISSLNSDLSNTKEQLQTITEEKDSISIFGKHISKTTYNIIMWSAVLGLLLGMLLFIIKFRQSNYLTQEAKNNLAELETEYENHRRRALEREQRISRELQDEINKYRNKK